MDWTIQLATDRDHHHLSRLLSESGLPADHITVSQFLVARDAERLIGCVAISVLGPTAMLQSLAVTPACRMHGLGRELVDAAVMRAKATGCTSVAALTIDAAGFFRGQGFQVVARESLDAETLTFWQFTAGVCSTATCLVRDITPPSAAGAVP